MITRDNYEIYFIDYFDGNLSEEQEALLFQFLEENSDLKLEFEEFQNIKVDTHEDFAKPDLSFLKKSSPINAQNEDEYFIAYLENDLSSSEQDLVKNYINGNLLAQQKFNRYQKVTLTAPTISYPEKSKLKRRAVIISFRTYLTVASIAAGLLFILWIIPFNSATDNGNVILLSSNVPKIDRELNSYSIKDTSKIEFSYPYNTQKNIADYRQREVNIIEKTPANKLQINSSTDNLKTLFNNKVDKFEPVIIKEDLAQLNQTQTQQKNKVITPRQLINRGISGFFLEEPKDEIKTDDMLAVVGVEMEKKKSTSSNVSNNSDDDYFTIKIGKVFEFKRKKRK